MTDRIFHTYPVEIPSKRKRTIGNKLTVTMTRLDVVLDFSAKRGKLFIHTSGLDSSKPVLVDRHFFVHEDGDVVAPEAGAHLQSLTAKVAGKLVHLHIFDGGETPL